MNDASVPTKHKQELIKLNQSNCISYVKFDLNFEVCVHHSQKKNLYNPAFAELVFNLLIILE